MAPWNVPLPEPPPSMAISPLGTLNVPATMSFDWKSTAAFEGLAPYAFEFTFTVKRFAGTGAGVLWVSVESTPKWLDGPAVSVWPVDWPRRNSTEPVPAMITREQAGIVKVPVTSSTLGVPEVLMVRSVYEAHVL